MRNDPVMNAQTNGMRFAGMNVNHATNPVIRKILSESLGEFDPGLWGELKGCSVSAQVAALKTYEAVRKRLTPSF
jgi:hypothetical protein